MISRIDLKHFKCFELLRLPMAPLTLLSGTNASGKSTLLQALILLHQTMLEHEWSNRLLLNGKLLKLGTVGDVLDKVHGRKLFEISVFDNERLYHWLFSGERGDMSMLVETVRTSGKAVDKPETLRFLLPAELDESDRFFAERMRGLSYITAERVGPREVYSLEDQQVATVVGAAGEYAASVLHWRRDDVVIDSLVLPGAPPTMLKQVEERMRNFFPGCSIALQQIPNVNAVTLGFRTSDETNFHRPIHVGFGLTQVFPIIVAVLSAKRGDIILVENPEVHLHPAGQALMGFFLSEAANAGIQIIIETHSDHILNGIRRSVKSDTIQPDQLLIHFFRPRVLGAPQIISPQIDKTGNIDAWPEGFFDQYEKDTNYFAGWED